MTEQKAATSNQLPSYKIARKKTILFGLFGADRRYIGDTVLGNAKLLTTICTFGIYGVPWWIVDAIIITKHKDDWEQWLTSKQAKKQEQKLKQEQIAKARAEGKALMAERLKKGLCTACGSDKVQTVPETYSKTTLGSGDGRISLVPGVLGTREVVKTRMVRICSSCGFKKVM